MKKSFIVFIPAILNLIFLSCNFRTNRSENPKVDISAVLKNERNIDFPTEEEISSKKDYSAKNIIVSLKDELSEESVNKLASDYNLTVLYFYRNFKLCALSSEKSLTDSEMQSLMNLLKNDERVNFVERDGIIRLD